MEPMKEIQRTLATLMSMTGRLREKKDARNVGTWDDVCQRERMRSSN